MNFMKKINQNSHLEEKLSYSFDSRTTRQKQPAHLFQFDEIHR
jgi:hypothetical protein